ncbi:MAG: CPBP family intramembrane metalloprotease [Prevotellaceae bacterium]|jgi:membrane protease YdiL (CAAX protease family)|nr:CPBP family intramembrane metalloprotease [Prevotellaceae bacterium]
MNKNIFAILIFIGVFCLGLLIFGILAYFGNEADIPYQKFLQAAQSVLIFALPVFACVFFTASNPKKFLRLKSFSLRNFWLTAIFAFTAIPAVNFIALLNEKMRLPSFLSEFERWAAQTESELKVLTEQFLTVNSVGGLLVNLIIIALLAAVSEELLFRGFIQRILERFFKNMHLAIWVTAFIFSAIHLQFYGFFPRMLLGAAFGYMLCFTGSLWLPMLAHFINNAVSVIIFYIVQNYFPNTNTDTLDISVSQMLPFAVGCLILSLGLLWQMRQKTTIFQKILS